MPETGEGFASLHPLDKVGGVFCLFSVLVVSGSKGDNYRIVASAMVLEC